jgi:hypothetical protein
MNEKVTAIVRTPAGGILYYNNVGEIISTGSVFDKAAPNPNLQIQGSVVFYSNNSDRTLYGVANGSTSWLIQTPTYTITANLLLDNLLQILAEEVFFLTSGGGSLQDLDSVLTVGNNAGANNIDLNGNNISNAFRIESVTDAELKIESLGTGLNTSGISLITGGTNKITIPETGYITTQVQIAPKSIVDSLGSLGTAGQFLQSTGLGINWANTTDPAGWSYVVKSANQDVINNATLQDDIDLKFAVVAAGHYMIELDLVISTNDATLAKFKQSLTLSAGTQKGSGNAVSNSLAGSASVIGMFANGTASSTTSTIGTFLSDLTGGLFSLKIIYSFIASTNAVFKYQFSNSVAGAGHTSRTWKGSILKYKRID